MAGKEYCSTRHGAKRTKERVGIRKKLADKNAERAHLYGVHQREVKGSLRRYIDLLFFQSMCLSEIRIYNCYIYLFAVERLVTVLPLPQRFRKTATELQRKHNMAEESGQEELTTIRLSGNTPERSTKDETVWSDLCGEALTAECFASETALLD